MMKVYIAGAITDNPNYREQFKAAEERLTALGYAVINPCKNDGFTYREYINMGLCELMHCDAIYLLKGYEKSTGATLEHDYARTVGLKVMREAAEELTELHETIKRDRNFLKRVSLRAPESELSSLERFLKIADQLGGNAEIDQKSVRHILKLVKKAQPREILRDYGFTLCPHCSSDVDEYDEYCSQCGQHLR